MWSYLEIRSLQIKSGKMDEVINIGTNPIWLVSLYKEKIWTHRHTRMGGGRKHVKVKAELG